MLDIYPLSEITITLTPCNLLYEEINWQNSACIDSCPAGQYLHGSCGSTSGPYCRGGDMVTPILYFSIYHRCNTYFGSLAIFFVPKWTLCSVWSLLILFLKKNTYVICRVTAISSDTDIVLYLANHVRSYRDHGAPRLHFGPKMTWEISIVFEDLSRNLGDSWNLESNPQCCFICADCTDDCLSGYYLSGTCTTHSNPTCQGLIFIVVVFVIAPFLPF